MIIQQICMYVGLILLIFWIMCAIIWLVLLAVEALEEMDE